MTHKIVSAVVSHDISDLLIKDVSTLIDEAKNHIAREYNSTQALLCWLIGKRIDDEVLKSERAEYGESIVVTLSSHLALSYGKGYSRPNLFRMIKFAKLFPDREIVSTLSRQLSWSHFVLICAGKDHDDIEYLEMDKTGIHVAQYLTEMPPKEILEAHLRKAITIAKENHLKKSLCGSLS